MQVLLALPTVAAARQRYVNRHAGCQWKNHPFLGERSVKVNNKSYP